MDISDDLDDLPEIILDSSQTEADKSVSFEMPDAAVIAAERKLALEQEEQIKRFKEESIIDNDDVSSELVEELKKVPTTLMPFEHPGISLHDLNRMDVIGNFAGPRSIFLMELMETLPHCKDASIAEYLKWYLDSVECSIKENEDCFDADDIHCNVVALSLLYLDKNCNRNVNIFRAQDLMIDLLNRTGKRHQSEGLAISLTEHLLKIVSHFHNRIALAQFFNHANIGKSSQPEYFSRKISMALTVSTLASLLGHRQQYNADITVRDLKDMIATAPRWNRLNPYEQYCMMILIMNLLKVYSVIDCTNDGALKDVLLSLSGIKSNEKWNNGEFLKVKNLIAKTKLFVQSRNFQHGQSPKKQNPLVQKNLLHL